MIGHRQMNGEDYLGILRRRFWLIVVPIVLGPALGLGVAAVLPERYVSQTLVLVVQPSVSETMVKPLINEMLNDRLGSMREQILSRARLQPIVERFGLYRDGDKSTEPMEVMVGRLRAAVQVTPVQPIVRARADRDLPGFFISVTLSDGRMAQQVCQEITSMFLEENTKYREQRSQNTTDFFIKELDEAKLKLDTHDKNLAAFKQQFLGQLPGTEQITMNVLLSATSQLDAVNIALSRAHQDKTFLEANLAQRIAAWEASKSGTNPVTFEQQLTAAKSALISLEARYTSDHPDVIKARADVTQLEKRIAEAKTTETAKAPQTTQVATLEPPDIQQTRAQIYAQEATIKEKNVSQQKLQEQIRILQARVQLSPVVEQRYKELTRDYNTASENYNDLLRKKNTAEIATSLERRQQGETFQMVDAANLPERPAFPNRLMFASGGLGGGLALGLVLVFFLEFRDKSMRTESDVEALLGLPTLALIPVVGDVKPAQARRWIFGKRGIAPAHGSQA